MTRRLQSVDDSNGDWLQNALRSLKEIVQQRYGHEPFVGNSSVSRNTRIDTIHSRVIPNEDIHNFTISMLMLCQVYHRLTSAYWKDVVTGKTEYLKCPKDYVIKSL